MKRSIKIAVVICFNVFSSLLFSQELDNLKEVKPIEFSGSFTLFGSLYDVNGIDARRKDFSWYLTGNPMLRLYGIEMPFSFTVSEQERSFRQPFNQFCISPSYKWAKAHIGYTNLNWSPFTWSGQTALGAAVELNPGKFRFGALYGRLNRAVSFNPFSPDLQTPAYKRTGYSVRVGYGTQTSHVDLIYVKAKDDQNSLTDTSQTPELLPSENAVVGISSKLKFSNSLFFDTDIAASVFTRDLNSLPITGEEALLVDKLKFLINANTSTQIYGAYQAEARLERKLYKLKVKYRRVDPDYQSMGTYFFQTDIENISFEPSVYLLKNKLKIAASVGQQKDNLMNKKSYTTKRFIGNIVMDWNISNVFGLNTMYSNFSGEQSAGLKIPNQQTQQSYVSQNFLIMPRLSFIKEKFTHFHTVLVNRQMLTDKNPNTAMLTEYVVDNFNYSSTYMLNKSGLTFGLSFLMTRFNSNQIDNRLSGIGANVSKSFLSNKINTSLQVNGTQQKINHENFADILNFVLQNTYKINNHNGITLQANYLDNKAKTDNGFSFTEYNIDLGYTYTF